MNAPRRILIFGGTFDPPHLAHARLPALAAQQLDCDEILYIPAAINPLKAGDDLPPPTVPEHRLAMLLLTVADVPDARVSTIELDRPGKSYTIDTLRQLAPTFKSPRQRAKPALFLLIGSDQALSFHQWKDWKEILKLATPAVMIRPPLDETSFFRKLDETYSKAEAARWEKWTLTRGLPLVDMSATDIRRRLAEGKNLDGLLFPAVIDYIRANKLYR